MSHTSEASPGPWNLTEELYHGDEIGIAAGSTIIAGLCRMGSCRKLHWLRRLGAAGHISRSCLMAITSRWKHWRIWGLRWGVSFKSGLLRKDVRDVEG